MNVLVIPEDFRKDQFIIMPIVRRMFSEIGKPNANIRVCFDPLLGGIGEAMKWERIEEILNRYRGMVQVFLLIVDRDGVAGRRQSLDALESKSSVLLGAGRVFFAENAWQEIEVWLLAAQKLPPEWKWQEIRAEEHSKEAYFEPLVRSLGLLDEPGEGRTTLGRVAATNYSRVRSLCIEDILALENRLRAWFEGS